jgi:hypothetical protein
VVFLLNLKTPLESLELGLLSGTEMHDFAWDELARALGERTRLTVYVDVRDQEGLDSEAEDDAEQDGEASILVAQFPKLEERGMLEFKRIRG